MEVTKIPKKIVTVIEPKRSMTVDKEKYRQKRVPAGYLVKEWCQAYRVAMHQPPGSR